MASLAVLEEQKFHLDREAGWGLPMFDRDDGGIGHKVAWYGEFVIGQGGDKRLSTLDGFTFERQSDRVRRAGEGGAGPEPFGLVQQLRSPPRQPKYVGQQTRPRFVRGMPMASRAAECLLERLSGHGRSPWSGRHRWP